MQLKGGNEGAGVSSNSRRALRLKDAFSWALLGAEAASRLEANKYFTTCKLVQTAKLSRAPLKPQTCHVPRHLPHDCKLKTLPHLIALEAV